MQGRAGRLHRGRSDFGPRIGRGPRLSTASLRLPVLGRDRRALARYYDLAGVISSRQVNGGDMRLCCVAVAFIALGTPLGHAQESARLVNCRLEGARGKVEFAGK